ERRVHELRAFARGTSVVPILVQQDPDPDGMASALGLRTLLHRTEEDSPIISLGEVTRPENERLAELIGFRVVRVTKPELHGFQRIIAVDTQPVPAEARTRYAVVDHHPARSGYSADFLDIRPEYGAAATIVTEYLRVADQERITPRLATALLYGIRTDTDVLRRGTVPADIAAYAFLQGVADQEMLRTIGRPAFSESALRAVGKALSELRRDRELAVAYVGRLDHRASHVLPNLADFCLAIEGVSWSAAAGLVDGELTVNIRHVGGGPGAGDLARELAREEGMGGGHQTMARVAIHLRDAPQVSEDPGDRRSADWLLDYVARGIEALRAVR
ncbi:MAG TPA: DHH family phosphoesterase, partial [Longimicrobiales bacterium]|nr:DHH family phosphoesterase [Longimicrobiales bacterium]